MSLSHTDFSPFFGFVAVFRFADMLGTSATREPYRPGAVRIGIPGTQFEHWPDGRGQEDWLGWVERGRDLAADERG